MTKSVLSLDGGARWTSEDCGNKAYTLYRLFQAGSVHVPDAFTVTWPALRSVFYTAEEALYSGRDPSNSKLEETRMQLMGIDLWNLPLAHEIGESLNRIAKGPEHRVIVRSSSSAEDSASAAFPGVFESLCVDADLPKVLGAIRQVYMSRLSPRAISYARVLRSNRNLVVDLIQPMAVLVQRYVMGKLGGVIFTADPMDKNQARIDIAVGGAERIVMGEQPDLSVGFGPSNKMTEAERTTLRSLVGTEQLAQNFETDLKKAIWDTTALLQSPVDIEWVWDGVKVWIVQARPIR